MARISKLREIIGQKRTLIYLLAAYTWLCLLIPTDAYYAVYLVVGIFSIFTVCKGNNRKNEMRCLDRIFAVIFSTFVCLANFQIYSSTSPAIKAIFMLLMFISGYFVFINVLVFLKNLTLKTTQRLAVHNPLKFSLICFFIMSSVYLLVMFLCFYPGVLTPDSVNQVEQFLSGSYNNHHPVFVTMIFKFFISLGKSLFGDINAGIAVYSVFQILLLSAVFSYAIYTCCQTKVSRKVIISLFVLSTIMPFNIMYSFTLWKDVLFGTAFLAFVIAMYRYFNKLDRHICVSIIILIVSGLSICLFRSNGLIAFAVAAIFFLLIFRKEYLRLGIILCSIALVALLIKKPLLSVFGISQPDTVESLAIPMQQVTLTLKERRDSFSKADLDFINKVANPDRLAEEYNPELHDPIKYVVRKEGDQDFLKGHKLEFLGLYVKYGLKNPGTYLKAWINQTRGYWNSGYSYWRWSIMVVENDRGIERSIYSRTLHALVLKYLDLFETAAFLNPFVSIGLFVWIMLLILHRALSQRDKYLICIALLSIFTWGTLLIATPVFSEFRYVYFIFTCIPPLAIISLTKSKVENGSKK